MAEELKVNENSRVEQVGRTGIFPASGPRPAGNAVVRTEGELGHPEQRRQLAARTSLSRPRAGLLGIGRVLLGGYFLYNGINHFRNRDMLSQYARSKGVPAADMAVPASGVLLLLGGLSLIAGFQPKAGAAMIATFLIGVTPVMHGFWLIEDQAQRGQELVNFTKNAALVGAAALVAAMPEPWPASVGELVQ